ncbi:MAG: response regulator transcription factor [Planctomycetota bacterium]
MSKVDPLPPGDAGDWLARVRASCAGARVVVVDDEPAVLQMTSSLLMAAGFRTTTFADGDEALVALRQDPPDLLLLDVLLRGRTGIEICSEIRNDPRLARVPVILVTGAHVSVADQVLGFGVGADDYVLKPWTPEILLSRVSAVLRRVRGAAAERLTHGPLVIDPARREATLEGALLPLTPTEFHIVHRLVANPDRALTRAELLDEVTDAGAEVAARNVDVHVLAIRRKLGTHRYLLQTVFRVGYRIAPV